MAGRTEQAHDRFSQAVDGPMAVITLLWLPVLIVPLVVPLRGDVALAFDTIDYAIWALFVAEYLAKLYLSPSRWRFVRSHVLDLLIVAVPIFRPLRAARLVRLARLARVGVILADGLGRAKSVLTHKGLHFVLLAVAAILFAGAAMELAFESHAKGSNIHNYADALWWAIATLTTVGYGDRFPVTAAGRGVAVVLMLVGIGLIGVLTATVASFFVEQKTDDATQRLVAVEGRLERMEQLLLQIAGFESPNGVRGGADGETVQGYGPDRAGQ